MAPPEETWVHESISHIFEWLKLAIETLGAVFILFGVIAAIRIYLTRRQDERFNKVRLALARYLVLALEFQLAADILSTAIAPSWEAIGKLAAIAAIRTVLNYFLEKEMEKEERNSI